MADKRKPPKHTSIGCTALVLEVMRDICDEVQGETGAATQPRDVTQLLPRLRGVLTDVKIAEARQNGYEVSISFRELGLGDARRIDYTNTGAALPFAGTAHQSSGRAKDAAAPSRTPPSRSVESKSPDVAGDGQVQSELFHPGAAG